MKINDGLQFAFGLVFGTLSFLAIISGELLAGVILMFCAYLNIDMSAN